MTPSKPGATKSRRPAARQKGSAATKKAPVEAPERSEPGFAKVSRAEELESRALQQMGGLHLATSPIAAAGPQSGSVPGGRYVYGVIQGSEPVSFGRSGLAGSSEQVYTVHYLDIAAVVSRTSVFIFDPTRENALAHEHVIELVMKTNTIIPMSFGTVFRTDDDIREVLKSIYGSLKDVLKQMGGKVEFGLKVTWDRDRIIEELKHEDDEIYRFQLELTKKHLQSTYFARMQLGRMIDKALVERSALYVREIENRKREMAGLEPEEARGPFSGKVGEGSGASLTVEFSRPDYAVTDRKTAKQSRRGKRH